MIDYENEFATVELILNSDFETKGVDSFVISLTKVEKQIRKIFTYLIFQNPKFDLNDINSIRDTLSANTKMYFENFIEGINQIYPKTVKEIYGSNYDTDLAKLNCFKEYRNKIFHGQITNIRLSRIELLEAVFHMKKWCLKIAKSFQKEINYDGFGRNSYRKNPERIILSNNKVESIDLFKEFLVSIDKSKKRNANKL